MERKLVVAPEVRRRFAPSELRTLTKRLSRRPMGCTRCYQPLSRSIPASLVLTRHPGDDKHWADLAHPDCVPSGCYVDSAMGGYTFLEVECALFPGLQGGVPGVVVDAHGGYCLSPRGDLIDGTLNLYRQVGFADVADVVRERPDGPKVDETETTPNAFAELDGTMLTVRIGDVPVFSRAPVDFYPRWYRALDCGALPVLVGRGLNGMVFRDVTHIRRAAAQFQLVGVVAKVAVTTEPEQDDSCICTKGAGRRFADCCGNPDGPEE